MPLIPDAVTYVSPRILRDAFNNSQIPEDIEQERLTPYFLRDNHLENPERVAEERCTRGQMIRYVDQQGTWIVEVFQYMRPDGTLGASGRQDPKRMRVGNEVWVAERV